MLFIDSKEGMVLPAGTHWHRIDNFPEFLNIELPVYYFSGTINQNSKNYICGTFNLTPEITVAPADEKVVFCEVFQGVTGGTGIYFWAWF